MDQTAPPQDFAVACRVAIGLQLSVSGRVATDLGYRMARPWDVVAVTGGCSWIGRLHEARRRRLVVMEPDAYMRIAAAGWCSLTGRLHDDMIEVRGGAVW